MPHTKSLRITDKTDRKLKSFGELQTGDWFFADGTYWIRIPDTTRKGSTDSFLLNACRIDLGSGVQLIAFPTEAKVHPIKEVEIKVEWC